MERRRCSVLFGPVFYTPNYPPIFVFWISFGLYHLVSMCSLWVYVSLAKVHCGATPPSVMVLFTLHMEFIMHANNYISHWYFCINHSSKCLFFSDHLTFTTFWEPFPQTLSFYIFRATLGRRFGPLSQCPLGPTLISPTVTVQIQLPSPQFSWQSS